MTPDEGVLENRRVVHGAPPLHRLVVPPVREDVLLHILVQCLAHLIHVPLVLHWYFLDFRVLVDRGSVEEGPELRPRGGITTCQSGCCRHL
jgi:hypothetical protein